MQKYYLKERIFIFSKLIENTVKWSLSWSYGNVECPLIVKEMTMMIHLIEKSGEPRKQIKYIDP